MPATVTLSLEIELGWGLVQYNKMEALSPDRIGETHTLEQLINICDELNIPFSFDIVGHLLLDEPLSKYNGNHPDGWFSKIPKTDRESDPEFYAPDIIDILESSEIDHELCTHTFTHVECTNVRDETLHWELQKVVDTHSQKGLNSPVSLVPPRHCLPSYDIINEYGIHVIRRTHRNLEDTDGLINMALRGKDLLTGEHQITPPRTRRNIIETYCTSFSSLTVPFLPSGQKKSHPIFRTLPAKFRQNLHVHNIFTHLNQAIREDSHLHLWSHLWEAANEFQWDVLERILQRLYIEKEKNNVNIKTMCELRN